MHLSTSIGTPSSVEHVGAIAIAGDVTVGEELLVRAVAVVVKRARLGMTGGTRCQ